MFILSDSSLTTGRTTKFNAYRVSALAKSLNTTKSPCGSDKIQPLQERQPDYSTIIHNSVILTEF